MSVFNRDFEFGGNRLIAFTGLQKERAREVLSWRNHPEVRRWMYSDTVISEVEHFSFIEKLKTDKSNFYWLLEDKKNLGIGVLYLNKVDQYLQSCEFGMYTNPFSQLKGGGIYIGRLAKKLAFEIGGLALLRLEVFADNETAFKINKLLGFKQESLKMSSKSRSGVSREIIVMSISKD